MTIDEKYLETINRCPIFSISGRFSTEDVLTALHAEKRDYDKGDLIHKSGEPFFKFGILLDGCARACIDDIDGNSMIMAEIDVGSTFGESLCYLKIADSPVYVVSSERSTVLWLDPAMLFDNTDSPLKTEIQQNYTKMLAKRTLSMNTRIQVLSKLRLRDKILTYLSSVANETGEMTFSVPLSREDLATYIGADRTALSRELSRLKREGVIDYYKNTFKIL
ncbi:MAG: Crp/Fnr family transcriptional regulator [Clostridia bacterium]|nr:Crp/Fnr family transcriptional regulator [Clostridia bacterium]